MSQQAEFMCVGGPFHGAYRPAVFSVPSLAFAFTGTGPMFTPYRYVKDTLRVPRRFEQDRLVEWVDYDVLRYDRPPGMP